MSYQRIRQETPPDEPEKRSSECNAWGCPLPGTFSTKPSGKNFFCRAHDGIDSLHWAEITTRVKAREKAMFAALDLTNATPRSDPPERTVAAFVQRYGDQFERRSKKYGLEGQTVGFRGEVPETARDYGQRVFMLLLEQVRDGFERHHIPADLRKMTEGLRKVDIQL